MQERIWEPPKRKRTWDACDASGYWSGCFQAVHWIAAGLAGRQRSAYLGLNLIRKWGPKEEGLHLSYPS